MKVWLARLAAALRRGDAAMLVHVVALRGSGPREAGAQMLVGEHWAHGTIGGGELERTAILRARQCLEVGRPAVSALALGPELNQCCGGSVTLAFEPFAPADLAWVMKLIQAAAGPVPVFRSVEVTAAGQLRRDWAAGGAEPDFSASVKGVVGDLAAAGTATIRERVNPEQPALFLFGAGHVGRAVAHALHPLDFAITWIDGRAGQFPEGMPPDIRALALAMPELAVEEAPEGAHYLVMTHSHPLDEAICEAVLRRGDFAYLGLIGSETKRARFARRLGAAGIPAERIARLVCPIGLPGITSKEPAAIAAAVAADLLLRRERAPHPAPADGHRGR